MIQTRREVEITLHSIHIPVTGAGPDKKTSHLLTAELIWPRTGVAQKSSSQSCILNEGRGTFESVNWGRRILFKETVEGHFALGLTLTEELDDEEVEKFLHFCAGAILSVSADLVESAAKPVGSIASAPLEYAAKTVAKYPGAKLMVEGVAELDADDFPPSGGNRLLTVQMSAARKLMRGSRHTVNGRARLSQKLLLEKGAPDGEITLDIHTL